MPLPPFAQIPNKNAEKAQASGQSLHAQQMTTRNLDEAEGMAKLKHMMKANPNWQVNMNAVAQRELLCSPTPYSEVYRGEWAGFEVAVKRPFEQSYPPEVLDKLNAEITALRCGFCSITTNREPSQWSIAKCFHRTCNRSLVAPSRPIPSVSFPKSCLFRSFRSCTTRASTWTSAKVPCLCLLGLFGLLFIGFALLFVVVFHCLTTSSKTALKFALDTAKGLQFLHDNNLAHMSLKSTNLVVTDDLAVKLIDYGMSAVFNNSLDQERIYEPQWIAPEGRFLFCGSSS